MTPLATFFVVYLLILLIVIFLPGALIRSYLRHKPIGLQTVLDHVAIDLTYVIQLGLGNFCCIAPTGIILKRYPKKLNLSSSH